MPETSWAVGLKEGDSIYIREDESIRFLQNRMESGLRLFLMKMWHLLEYSKEPWVYQSSQRSDGFSLPFRMEAGR